MKDLVMNKSLLMILPAKNFNEQEYLITKNVLEKRGYKIFIASDANSLCAGEKGLKVGIDVKIFNLHSTNFCGLVIIGGEGIKNYWDNIKIHSAAKDFLDEKKPIAAICSAPVIFARAGLLDGKRAVCYQPDKIELEKSGAMFTDNPVVVDNQIITGRDFNTASEFAEQVLASVTPSQVS